MPGVSNHLMPGIDKQLLATLQLCRIQRLAGLQAHTAAGPVLQRPVAGDNQHRTSHPAHMVLGLLGREGLPDHVHRGIPAPANATLRMGFNPGGDNQLGRCPRQPRVIALQPRQGVSMISHGPQIAAQGQYGLDLQAQLLLQLGL